jgi:hypothetical protein
MIESTSAVAKSIIESTPIMQKVSTGGEAAASAVKNIKIKHSS